MTEKNNAKTAFSRETANMYRRIYIRNATAGTDIFGLNFVSDDSRSILGYLSDKPEYTYFNLNDNQSKISKLVITSSLTGKEYELKPGECIDRSVYLNDYVWFELTLTENEKGKYIVHLIIHED